MSKSKNSLSHKYLYMLGMATIGYGVLIAISALVMLIIKSPVDKLGLENLDELRKSLSDDGIRSLFVFMGVVSAIITAWIGNLLRRASKDPEKTTLALVFVVFQGISSAATLFSDSITNFSVSVGSIFSLTIYVLAFLSIMNIRKELD